MNIKSATEWTRETLAHVDATLPKHEYQDVMMHEKHDALVDLVV